MSLSQSLPEGFTTPELGGCAFKDFEQGRGKLYSEAAETILRITLILQHDDLAMRLPLNDQSGETPIS